MKQDRNLSSSRRSPSPQFKIKKNHKGKQKKNQTSQTSSFNTNSQSHEKQTRFPEEGKLLNFIKGLEAEQEKQVFGLKLSHFSIEEHQQILDTNDDLNDSQFRRQLQYNKHYYQEFQQSLINENVYLGHCLQHQKISQSLRSKMVDWMIEVLGNYGETTSNATFFRSVSIMDYYLKKSITQYSNNQLHLIGITSMFIATKLEDIHHIPLQDFVTRVGHNKYTASKIKAMEQSILETLNFEITFPTSLDYLQNIFYQCFSLNDDPNLQNILETSTYILKMCLHDYSITTFDSYTLASSSFRYSIGDYLIQNNSLNQDSIMNQFNKKIVQISQIDQIDLNFCQKKLQDLINNFKITYPELNNLAKFS